MAILASRLWDVEVKGCTPKLLYTLQSRRSLFALSAISSILVLIQVFAMRWNVVIGGQLFSDAMGDAGTPEGTYVGMVRYNIDTIVGALLAE